jgi:putative protein kinase ArgK-like GTPase of G3E family
MFIEQLMPTPDPLKCIKVKVFGSSGVGKSTLIDSLKCSYINSFFRRTRFASKPSILSRNQPNSRISKNLFSKL